MPGPFVQRGPQPRALAVRPRETWERESSLETNTRLAKRMECTWWSKSFTSIAWSDLGCLDLDRWTRKRSLSLFEGKSRKRRQLKTVEETAAETSCLTCWGSFELGLKSELVPKLDAALTSQTFYNPFKVKESLFTMLYMSLEAIAVIFWRRG